MRPISPVRRYRPSPDVTVIVVCRHQSSSLRDRSLRSAGALIIDVCAHRLARDGIVVEVPKIHAAFIAVLASRPGAVVPADEIMDILYGDREDGGPEGHRMVHTLRHRTGAALAALGFRIETEFGRGQWLRCCLSPLSITSSMPSRHLETVHAQD